MLHQGGSGSAVVRFQPAALLVAAVVLLNEHSGPPALLELLLFMVAAEFTLDKDGGLRHLLIKCILQGEQNQCVFARTRRILAANADGLRALPSKLSTLACKHKEDRL